MPAISRGVFGRICHVKLANECPAWGKCSKMLPQEIKRYKKINDI